MFSVWVLVPFFSTDWNQDTNNGATSNTREFINVHYGTDIEKGKLWFNYHEKIYCNSIYYGLN